MNILRYKIFIEAKNTDIALAMASIFNKEKDFIG